MNNQNNITNFDAKKSFIDFAMPYFIIPQIYIDEYWDYYIEEYGFKTKWNTFLEEFKEGGYTYKSFSDEFKRIVSIGDKMVYGPVLTETREKFIQVLSKFKKFKYKLPHINIYELSEGEYIYIDLHSACDEVLKYVGVLNDKFNGITDIINFITEKDIFKHQKQLKLRILDNIQYTRYIYLTFAILMDQIYKSEDKKLRNITKKLTLIGRTDGDAYMYKLNDDSDISELYGDYECKNLKYHIKKLEVKEVKAFENTYKIITIKDKNNETDNLYVYSNNSILCPGLYPFVLKLAKGEELNEKDLAVGYENEIFFHFDKSEII